MHATIRRYEGVDQARTSEVSRKVNETLVPKLRALPGFKGFYMIEAGNGVISSLGLFESPEQIELGPDHPLTQYLTGVAGIGHPTPGGDAAADSPNPAL